MESLVLYAIWASLILVGISVLAVGLFSLRNLAYGKVELLSVMILVVPAIILVVLGFIMQTWAQAAIVTMLIMFGLTLLALLVSGIRTLFI